MSRHGRTYTDINNQQTRKRHGQTWKRDMDRHGRETREETRTQTTPRTVKVIKKELQLSYSRSSLKP
jgi:hypothetical protein